MDYESDIPDESATKPAAFVLGRLIRVNDMTRVFRQHHCVAPTTAAPS